MYRYLNFIFILFLGTVVHAQTLVLDEPLRFLALGDSYTIGESVDENARWPVQLVDSLQSRGYRVDSLKIIATTGWRTDQLLQAIETQKPDGFNLVSLLIGVNNQYQGGALEVYKVEFEALLKKAIELAGGDRYKVFVLSIPDYAFTPFANGDTVITRELDAFNQINRSITNQYGVSYFHITDITRNGLKQPDLVAGDGLHPSEKMYALWVERIMEIIPNKNGITFSTPSPVGQISLPVVFIQRNDQLHIMPLFSPAHFYLYELGSGRLVLQYNLEPNTFNILNTSFLNQGIYLYSVVRNTYTRYTGKLFI